MSNTKYRDYYQLLSHIRINSCTYKPNHIISYWLYM